MLEKIIVYQLAYVQGAVIGEVNRRKGLILDSETKEGYAMIMCEVPLNDMFGFSATLRAATQVSECISATTCVS